MQPTDLNLDQLHISPHPNLLPITDWQLHIFEYIPCIELVLRYALYMAYI